MVALMYPPYRYEAKEMHDAMEGLGTKEGVIIEILASRTKSQLQEIMKAYEEDFGSTLEEDIQADTRGYLERILVCLLQGSRDDISGFVDPALALQDAQDLYAAGEKIRGTDEMKFITILTTRSATHLMRVFEEYEKIANKSIEDSIRSETHGSLEEAMLTVVKCTRNLHSYFAERLYYALKGAGTRDRTLIRNIVSRSEIDLNLIKSQFKKTYGKTLSSMIAVSRGPQFPRPGPLQAPTISGVACVPRPMCSTPAWVVMWGVRDRQVARCGWRAVGVGALRDQTREATVSPLGSWLCIRVTVAPLAMAQ
ncbi:annexin A8-like protein 1 isoform X1 [Choloepus didactylus]|uniref:annexin A8-like protein 1 isoform X1 n=1 Tax=Choloepus didactylus TaxID=27675 RepID=UPI0018A06A27|nr:annexin A8-like protein 1 isoform X1 [Choloepus didactylus]